MVPSCETSPVYDNNPKVNIPDLPNNVYAQETKVPEVEKLSKKQTKQLLLDFKYNEGHNVRAINDARRYVKKLQETYGK